MSIDSSVFLSKEGLTAKDSDKLQKDDLEDLALYVKLEVLPGTKKIPLKPQIISHLVEVGFLEDEGSEDYKSLDFSYN